MEAGWAQHRALLAGRHVVVTGAGGGIGRATALAFARAGAHVIAVDRAAETLRPCVKSLSVEGPSTRPSAVVMDFLDAESVSKGLAEVRATSRDILALVNVAGIAEDATMHMLTSDALSRHLTVNFEAQVRITQYVTRLMLKSGGGAVVSVASVTGIDGNEGQLAYGASKAALISATRTMSMELGRHGIRVNAVAPGVIDTDMTRSLPNDVREELLTRPAMGRLGTPDEVAACIMWLCSPAASYVTGQTLRIDGGMT